jgi:hypothetical protein
MEYKFLKLQDAKKIVNSLQSSVGGGYYVSFCSLLLFLVKYKSATQGTMNKVSIAWYIKIKIRKSEI